MKGENFATFGLNLITNAIPANCTVINCTVINSLEWRSVIFLLTGFIRLKGGKVE